MSIYTSIKKAVISNNQRRKNAKEDIKNFHDFIVHVAYDEMSNNFEKDLGTTFKENYEPFIEDIENLIDESGHEIAEDDEAFYNDISNVEKQEKEYLTEWNNFILQAKNFEINDKQKIEHWLTTFGLHINKFLLTKYNDDVIDISHDIIDSANENEPDQGNNDYLLHDAVGAFKHFHTDMVGYWTDYADEMKKEYEKFIKEKMKS